MPKEPAVSLEKVVEQLKAENAVLKTDIEQLKAQLDSPDPLLFLTPEAIEGIPPLVKILPDALRETSFVSINDAAKVRLAAEWLKRIYDEAMAAKAEG